MDEPRPVLHDAGEKRRPQRPIADEVADRVAQIVASAERAAAEIHRAAGETARRASADARAQAEADAARIRRDAQQAAQRWLSDTRERIDALTRERIARIDEVTHHLLAQSEALHVRFEAAHTIRAQVESLLLSLGDAAERLARETADLAPAHLTEVPRPGDGHPMAPPGPV